MCVEREREVLHVVYTLRDAHTKKPMDEMAHVGVPLLLYFLYFISL
jgi:hypothetical protein